MAKKGGWLRKKLLKIRRLRNKQKLPIYDIENIDCSKIKLSKVKNGYHILYNGSDFILVA